MEAKATGGDAEQWLAALRTQYSPACKIPSSLPKPTPTPQRLSRGLLSGYSDSFSLSVFFTAAVWCMPAWRVPLVQS
jgi:hypothetical protein